jgi:uncharacterized protein YdeI (YjbR/CyaY-like superfamily)
MHDGLPLFVFADARAFSLWLAENVGAAGAWIKFAKNGGASTLSKEDAIDCALCHGWIDSQIRSFDAGYYLTRFTPRKPNGRWSARNVERAEALIAQRLMQPAGLAEIEAAKADGRWSAAYPSASRAETPPDFEAALERDAKAKRAFAALDGANRYAILYRLHHAKPEARAQRIDEFVDMLAHGGTFHPPRKARKRSRQTAPTR